MLAALVSFHARASVLSLCRLFRMAHVMTMTLDTLPLHQ
jgi:hypothetical protein